MLGFSVEVVGFNVKGLGLRYQGSGLRIRGSEFRVEQRINKPSTPAALDSLTSAEASEIRVQSVGFLHGVQDLRRIQCVNKMQNPSLKMT